MAASQFELKEHHASIANVNNRIQRHGEERQLAADIKFNLSAPNTILDAFDPSLRKDLFRKPNRGEQQDLPHIGGDGLTEVKHTCLEPLKLNHEFTGYELQIDGHLDGTEPIVLVDVKLKKFVATPREGGSVDLSFTASAEIDSAEAAELTEAFLREDIHVKPLFGSASDREKATERQKLAADIARFQRMGGKVLILGTTAINKKGISRRQVVEGGADRRKSAKEGKP